MGFVVAAVLLALAILGLLAVPWWHRPGREGALPLSGDQLAEELNDDVAAGMLAPSDLKPATRDLEATAEIQADSPQVPARRWGWSVAALLLVPLAAVILYAHFGDWRAALLGEQAASLHQLELSLAQLRAHLAAHPDDMQGWIDLGQGEEAAGDYPQAVKAFGRAVALQKPPDPDVLGLWGEAQILADPQQVTPQEQQIFARVLKLDPDNERGLWYGGLIALSAGNKAEVIADWQRLLAQPDIPTQVAEVVRSHLAVLESAPASAGTAADAPGAATENPQIAVTVTLQPDLSGRVKPGQTLFVFVRGLQGGPPFAVRKIGVESFPVTVVLDDADAMLPGHDLSSAGGPVDIVARLSGSGNAAPQPGDLQGVRTITLKGGEQKLELSLDQILGSPEAATAPPAGS